MECILKCGDPCREADTIDRITDEEWSNIKTKAELWQGLDRFGDVFATTSWGEGQYARFMHNNCYINLCSAKKLHDAKTRFEKAKAEEIALSPNNQGSSSCKDTILSPSPKRTRLSTGFVHNKKHCLVLEIGG